jgi:hypothetical protein
MKNLECRLTTKNADTVFADDFWPDGIGCRKFIRVENKRQKMEASKSLFSSFNSTGIRPTAKKEYVDKLITENNVDI